MGLATRVSTFRTQAFARPSEMKPCRDDCQPSRTTAEGAFLMSKHETTTDLMPMTHKCHIADS